MVAGPYMMTLGAKMSTWQPVSDHELTWVGVLQVWWACLLAALISLSLGIGLLFVATKPGDTFTKFMICGAFITLGLPLLCSPFVWHSYYRVSSVRLFQEGIEWTSGKKEYRLPWENLKEVYRKEKYTLHTGQQPSDWNRSSDLKLVFANGRVLRVNHALSDYNALCYYLQQLTTPVLLPAARADVEGEGAVFGPVLLSKDGLTHKKTFFHWDTIEDLIVGNGKLFIRLDTGREKVVPLEIVPNYPVLLQVLEFLGRPAHPPRT